MLRVLCNQFSGYQCPSALVVRFFESDGMANAKFHREFQQAHHPFGNPSDASWTSVSGSSTSGSSVASNPHFTFIPLPMAVDPPAKKPHTYFFSEESSSLAADPSNADEGEPRPTSDPALKADSKPNVRDSILRYSLYLT